MKKYEYDHKFRKEYVSKPDAKAVRAGNKIFLREPYAG